MKRYFLCIILCAALALPSVYAEVKLPAVFSDHTVLQQQSSVSIWGWAKPNTSVKLTGSWNKKTVTAKSNGQGYWKASLQTPKASMTAYTLTVSDGKAVVLQDVLIGEVWICSGQSNMEMPMSGWGGDQPIAGGPDDILNSTDDGLRCFTVEKKSVISPQNDCKGSWEIAGPQTTPRFTATGYYFGRLLRRALDVPVGLIHTSWGGSRIEAWMTPASLKDIPEKKLPQTDADNVVKNGTPTVLYNGMLHPLVGYGIRGAIWYQGESNRGEPSLYVKMFDKMVREWRNIWGVGEFPFYYCQIAPYNYGGGRNSAYIREAQAIGMLTPNTGMAVLMDANSPGCIHPSKKIDAGQRLALWALAKTYGMNGMVYRSPEVESMKTEGRVAIVTFNLFGSSAGLTTHGKELTKFQIAGNDKRFHAAKAALAGNKVYLFSPYVSEPVAVRYCWDDTSATELFTVEGALPISSFRTDQWE